MNATKRKPGLARAACRTGLIALFLGSLFTGAPKANAQTSSNLPRESDDRALFATNAPLNYFRITITGTNLISLKKNPRVYVRATVRVGDAVYTDVGLHLKGNTLGSFQPVDKKPALTLNFDKFKHGQKFYTLDKIHLNNSAEDDTYLTEFICGELFRAAGVPAPRVTYAVVELNGRDCGLYVLKEGFDKTFLKRHFKDPNGNLYDGGFVNDIDESLKKDSGADPENRTDLEALARAAKEPDLTNRWQQLEKILDLDRFISFLAMEVLTCHWDGYAMNRNNYRIYHDPTKDKLVFLPHGMDVMFTDPLSPLQPYLEGKIARAVLETPEGSRRNGERLATLFTNVFTLKEMTNQINQLQSRIRPVLAAVSRKTAREHDEAVEGLRDRIRDRVIHVDRYLNLPEPASPIYDAAATAKLSGWWTNDPSGTAIMGKVVDSDGRKALHIRAGAGGRCRASWRTQVLLERADYQLEAMVRTVGVISFKDEKGRGAGIRISGSEKPRPNKVVGNSRWKKVVYDFEVNPDTGNEIELVCELLATKGEAWFDLDSIKLIQKRD